MPYLGCNRTRWHKIMDKMFCQPSALKYQKEKRNETKCGESLRWEKKHKKGGEPRHWDRGSEYGVIESAKGGGLGGGGGWGRSWRNAGMIESEYIKTHWEFSSVSFHLCPSLLISKGWQDPYLYTTYRVPSHQSAKEAQEKWKGMKRRKVESKKKIEWLWDLPLLLPQANPILSCLFYYPAMEQDRLVQYRACTDPFSFFFLGPWHENGKRERNRGGINK